MMKLVGFASMLSLMSLVSCAQLMPPQQQPPPPAPVVPVAAAPPGAGICHSESEILAVSGRIHSGKGQKDEDPRKGFYRYAYIAFDHPVCLKDDNYPEGELVKRAEYIASGEHSMSLVGHHVKVSGTLEANMMGNHAEAFSFTKQ